MSTKITKSIRYRTFALFQMFIWQTYALLVISKDFPEFESRKNLDLKKILGVTNIFLKSRFICTSEAASDCSAPSSGGDVKLMLPSTSVSSSKSGFSGSSTGLKSGFNRIVPGSGPSGISSGVTFMVKTTLSMDLEDEFKNIYEIIKK